MTLGDIATTARFKTNTDTTSYTDAQLLININVWYQKAVSMILESMDESDFDDARRTNYPIQTTPLIASQRDYTLPVSEKVLKIKRVDITYNGTDYYKAEPIDTGEQDYGLGNDTNTDRNFIHELPRYDIRYNSIFIYPLPTQTDVDAGGKIRVEWERQIQEFTSSDYTSVLTDSTVVPGFDDPFHGILSTGAAYEYAVAKQLPQLAQLAPELADWEQRIKTHYGRKELDRRLTLQPYYDDTFGR